MEKYLTRSDSNSSLSAKRPSEYDLINPSDWKIPKNCAPRSEMKTPPAISTNNMFSGLAADKPTSSLTSEKLRSATAVKSNNKVPPILMVLKPEWNHDYIQTLISRYTSSYHLLYKGNNRLAIYCYSSESHQKLQEGLRAEKMSFHTFSRKDERQYKAVIFGLPSYVEDLLSKELHSLGFQGTTVRKLKTAAGKEVSCPPYLVQLPPGSDMSSFRKIKYMYNCVVKIQKYKSNNFMGTQCYRCQSFGHSSKNCNLNARCVKCMEAHLTHECQKKNHNEPAQCCNCGEKHPANYRLCSAHQSY
ncbi:uncharacterized protein [Epargyreus clarus]|uniref:uncharacterized protein n=1 Tax=Epargyreus clarus TaxID=520877 RepID=UPI003C30B253